jgi:hypothetical protein
VRTCAHVHVWMRTCVCACECVRVRVHANMPSAATIIMGNQQSDVFRPVVKHESCFPRVKSIYLITADCRLGAWATKGAHLPLRSPLIPSIYTFYNVPLLQFTHEPSTDRLMY